MPGSPSDSFPFRVPFRFAPCVCGVGQPCGLKEKGLSEPRVVCRVPLRLGCVSLQLTTVIPGHPEGTGVAGAAGHGK